MDLALIKLDNEQGIRGQAVTISVPTEWFQDVNVVQIDKYLVAIMRQAIYRLTLKSNALDQR